MIYSARVLEIHANRCACEANSKDEAGEKFLKGLSDCNGYEEYVSTVSLIDVQEDPNQDVELVEVVDPKDAEVIVAKSLEVKQTTATMKRLHDRFTAALERIESLESAIDNDEDNAYPHLVSNNWHGLRGFIAGLKDELEGTTE